MYREIARVFLIASTIIILGVSPGYADTAAQPVKIKVGLNGWDECFKPTVSATIDSGILVITVKPDRGGPINPCQCPSAVLNADLYSGHDPEGDKVILIKEDIRIVEMDDKIISVSNVTRNEDIFYFMSFRCRIE